MDECHVCHWQRVVLVLLSLAQISIQYDELLVPPKFPDLLSSFAESLSSSENLRHIVSLMKEDAELCGCGDVTKVNWTEFNANIGSYLLPADSELCSSDFSTHHRNVAAVSSGQGDGEKGLIIGLSLGFVAVVLVVVVLLTIKKYPYIHAAWVAVKKKSVSLRKQKSDCQPALTSSSLRRPVIVSVSDSVAYSDTASVSEVGCFRFPGKVRTILLPLKTQKEEVNLSELPTYVANYPLNLSKGKDTIYTGNSTEM